MGTWRVVRDNARNGSRPFYSFEYAARICYRPFYYRVLRMPHFTQLQAPTSHALARRWIRARLEAAEKAKMAMAEEAQRAEVARLMETLTPAQARCGFAEFASG